MGAAQEDTNRRLLRARDAIDLAFDQPLDVAALARIAYLSPAHFTRSFRAAFGETPHRYLQRRRIERAMHLLVSSGLGVGDVCTTVGWTSFATFSRTFREVVGQSPSEYRASRPSGGRAPVPAPGHPLGQVPTCFQKAWCRPSAASRDANSSFGQAAPGQVA